MTGWHAFVAVVVGVFVVTGAALGCVCSIHGHTFAKSHTYLRTDLPPVHLFFCGVFCLRDAEGRRA